MTLFKDIPHPTNRVWPGTPQHVMPTAEEAYEEGFQRGNTWPAEWQYVPGGPWVGSRHHYSGYAALEAQERLVHRQWMRGWHAGFKRLHPRPAKRPSWYRPLDDWASV